MADRCTSYDDFKTRFLEIRKNNAQLNRLTKPEVVDIDVKTAFIRGAVISVMAVWEAYLQELLEEVFELVVGHIKESKEPAAVLTQEAPRLIVRKSIENYLDKSKLDKKSKLDAAADMGMDLLANPDLWKEILEKYEKSVLDKPLHLTPVFLGDDGIDKRFKGLLKTTKDLSDVIISQGVVCHEFVCAPNDFKPLEVHSSVALNDVIRLYYGTRCAFAHGKNERTIQEGGVLFKFPSCEALQSRVGKDKRIGERLHRLFENIESYGSTAWIQYLHLINLQRFVMILAYRLCVAVSQVVFEEFGITIWRFDPTTIRQEENTLDVLCPDEDKYV